jgi:hypothetical protein
MPGTPTNSKDDLGLPQSAVRDTTLQFQKAVDDLETLRAKVNAIITAAGTSLAAVAAVPALPGSLTAVKIGDDNNNPIS